KFGGTPTWRFRPRASAWPNDGSGRGRSGVIGCARRESITSSSLADHANRSDRADAGDGCVLRTPHEGTRRAGAPVLNVVGRGYRVRREAPRTGEGSRRV